MQGIIGHNFHSYTLHKTCTSDTEQDWTKSCAGTLKTNSHFLQKNSILKITLGGNSSWDFHLIIFLRPSATCLHRFPSPQHPKSLYRSWPFSLFIHYRVLHSMLIHDVLFIYSWSVKYLQANHMLWLYFYALCAKIPLSIFRVYRIPN